MGRIRLAGLLLALSTLAGCAVVQKPIPASSALFENKTTTIAVAVEKLPEPTQIMLGQQGLLDIVINKANAAAIVERLQKQDFSMISDLGKAFGTGLESRQIKVVMIDKPLDTESLPKFTEGSGQGVALRDYRALAKQYNADRLLLLTPRELGTVRYYYGFLPQGAPVGHVALTGQLVNLSSNRLEWYERVEINTAALGEWDQAPEYENLMRAVTESTRSATSRLRGAFFMENLKAPVQPVAGTPVSAAQ
ncbi:hypothetical protein [Cupriavidus sp. RAF12]|uniref:hypothetical protein n=1 Tax=Cupriavidus sp. RAF12 TaxID=3233050 RepID=UPI003F8E5D33